MASGYPSISYKELPPLPHARFGIAVARWNELITEALYRGAYGILTQLGASPEAIIRKNTPGSYELPLAAKKMIDLDRVDAVICLGCIIRGETPHFDYICAAVAQSLMQVGLATGKPVSFGVITALSQKQALDRAGGRWGNKGEEAALAAVEMLVF